jgi:hypothetical protein
MEVMTGGRRDLMEFLLMPPAMAWMAEVAAVLTAGILSPMAARTAGTSSTRKGST